MSIQRTLAIVKPDVLNHAAEIVDDITEAGYTVLQRRRVHMTPEQISDVFADLFQTEYFTSFVAYMSSGPCDVLVLTNGASTVLDFLSLCGPEDPTDAVTNAPDSLRAKYGSTDPSTRYQTGKNLHNALHASNTPAAAKREIQIFFPSDVMEPLPTSESSREYLAEKVNPTLLKGLTALAKAKPADPLRFLACWLEANNPNQPTVSEPDD